MKRRPLFLTLLSSFFLIVAISFPLQVLVLYGHTDLFVIFNKISFLNFLVAVVLLAHIPLLLRASGKLKYSLPVLLILVMWNNFVVGSYAFDYKMSSTALASVGFIGACSPMLTKKIRDILNNPGMRWWLTPRRAEASLSTLIHPYVGSSLQARTLDISETGVYIAAETCRLRDSEEDFCDGFNVGDLTSITIKLGQFHSIKCEAEVVRVADESYSHPAGYGLRFLNPDITTKSHLKQFIANH